MSSVAPTARRGGPAVGLPEGVYLAPLGRRLAAFLLDALVPHILLVLGVLNLARGGPAWLTIIFWVLVVVWALVLLWMYGKLAAGPGMRLMHLQLVGLHNGRPIGLARAFVRGIVLALLSDATILLIVMALLMLQQPRRQGWHDLAADSVVIEERPLAPPRPGEIRDPRVWVRRLFSRPAAPSRPAPAAIEAGPAPQSLSLMEDREPQPKPQHEAVPPQPAPQPAAQPQPEPEPEPEAPAVPPNLGWSAVLDGNREIPITRLTLFGRNPQPRPGEDDAQLIKVVDEARTVSKTHLALDVDSRGVFVTDRGSTNGSAVTDPQGVYNLIAAEQPVRLPGEGYVVSFGSHHLRLIRH